MQQLAQDLDKLRGQVGGAKKTVSSLFLKGLQTLIQRLGCAEASFTRCMKPNPERVPHKCDGDIVLDQLKLSGAFETVKIRQNGFLIRQPCVDFVKRYLMIIKSTAAPVMYNIVSGVQDLELEFVAYDAGSIALMSSFWCSQFWFLEF